VTPTTHSTGPVAGDAPASSVPAGREGAPGPAAKPEGAPRRDAGAPSCFADLGAEIGRLVEEKQRAYGDSYGRSGAVMRILYPDGIRPEQMDDALAVVRVLDKLFRIATDRDALGESPWRDIAGYGLLGARRSGR
jgi:hypothetical protein